MVFAAHFELLIAALFVLIWAAAVAILRVRQHKSAAYLAYFSIFFAYSFKVLDYTLFQFQSLLLLKYFMPGLMLKGQDASAALNLVPLVSLTSQDLKTSLLNILLFVPFGFGLPFISNVRGWKIVAAGALVSLAIESLQLLTGLAAGMTFRVADVNDLLFNTLGTAIGYATFVVFARLTHGRFASIRI